MLIVIFDTDSRILVAGLGIESNLSVTVTVNDIYNDITLVVLRFECKTVIVELVFSQIDVVHSVVKIDHILMVIRGIVAQEYILLIV